jgi:MFS superfamily sulfate permease-like transporter
MLKADALSGLTVALVLIPQSVAYAQLAGLPLYYGLYAALLPPMIAALFGSSPQLSTGPVAVVSLLTAASLEPLATAGSEGYIAYAILLAFMVGLFQLALGVLRLGLVINFLSRPVVNGFTNAAAIIIASSQLSKLLGVYVDRGEHQYETIIRVIKVAIHYTHWPTLLMGAFAFAIMYGLKRISPRTPYVLVAVVVTTVLSWAIGFEHNTTVNISSIVYPKANQLITKFNTTVSAIPPLAQKRIEIIKDLEQAKRVDDINTILDAKRDSDLISIQIERYRYETHVYREEIRRLLFGGIKQSNGLPRFYMVDEIPAGARGDGRIWRIRVGNKPIKTNQLVMTGGGAVIGAIPSGLPSLVMPRFDPTTLMQLLPFAAIISLLGFMEAISIAKAMAAKTGQRLDPNQELIGQGLANICGAFGRSFPTSGSFSRSALNLQSGAVSGLSSVFTSLAVVVVLLFFTPLFYHLPQSVLAAIIMMAIIHLVNISGFIHAWRARWYDGVISVITFISTLLFAPHLEKGIMIGVVLSLVVFLYKSMRPTVASLSMSADKTLHDSTAFGLKQCEYIAVVRFDAPLFFANASYLEDQIAHRRRTMKNLKHIHIVSNGINDMDASGEEALSLIVDRVRSAGMDISLSGVHVSVMKVLKRTHLLEKIGEDHIYPTMEKAISAIHEETHRAGQEDACPLITVCRLA